MNKLKTTLGSYLPSFFMMEVDFPFSSKDLTAPFDEKWISVFTHEYIHFLQDITTFVGLNNAYVYSEHIHGLVNSIYQHPKGNLTVPVSIPSNYANIELNQFVNTEGIGTLKEVDEFFLVKIKRKRKKVPFQNDLVKKLTNVILKSAKGDKVVFGSRAIMESMAYMMERMITRGSVSAPDYPYNAAEMVVDYIYPEFGKDKLNIIALCDACMQFSEPGKIFVQTLEMFKSQKFIPDNANQVIDNFYSTPCIQIGNTVSMVQGLISMGMMVGDRLKLYLQGNDFKPFSNVIHKLLGFGMNERIKNRYFMLDIVRKSYALDNPLLQRYIAVVGAPIIKDCNEDYWSILPKGFSSADYWIDYFPAIGQVYNCLAEGQTICDMIPWCEKSPKVKVDDRCYMEPWSRVKDTYLCPYAMLWKNWNLEGYIPTEA